jgi:hypothetical protein
VHLAWVADPDAGLLPLADISPYLNGTGLRTKVRHGELAGGMQA